MSFLPVSIKETIRPSATLLFTLRGPSLRSLICQTFIYVKLVRLELVLSLEIPLFRWKISR